MKPKEYSLAERRSHLARLAKALLTKKFEVAFDMGPFARAGTEASPFGISPKNLENICGTTCCALGHTPLVIEDHGLPNEGWVEYGDRVMPMDSEEEDHEWSFLFAGWWPSSKDQFAARAYLFLTGMVPYNYDQEDYFPLVAPSDFNRFILP